MKFRSVIAGLLAAATLSACLIPEKFSSGLDFHSDASFDYHYSGTALNVMALMEMHGRGALSPATDAALKVDADKLAQSRETKSVKYLGNARYDISLAGHRNPGEGLKLLDILNVEKGSDGVITVSSPNISDKDRQELGKLGIKIDGTLDVKLPSGAQVISHNAQSTPYMFGLMGDYSWKIGTPDQRPFIKFRVTK